MLGAINCAAESTDVFNAVAAKRRAAESAVRSRIAAGQTAGELAKDVDVDALAGQIVATLYGLALKARDGGSRASLSRVVEQVMSGWPKSPTQGR